MDTSELQKIKQRYNIVGNSDGLNHALDVALQVAPTDLSVLIIGESYSKAHDAQYNYFLNTTPRQKKLERTGLLTKFTDVVSCWNLTSFVFKNVFSTHVVGEKGEWCDYPLFPELFRPF